MLGDEVARGRRVLLGVDFALGYPAGLVRAADLGDGRSMPLWASLWSFVSSAIDDTSSNANNRFDVARSLNRRVAPAGPGPFWGCPAHEQDAHLTAKRPAGFPYDRPAGLRRRRLVEQRIPRAHEVWKLYTTGSVGSQTLLGIARLADLWLDPALKPHLKRWPFDTGFTPAPLPNQAPGVVIAEVYPSLVNARADQLLASHDDVTIRDQAQVLALADHFARLDRAGRLAALFDRPQGLAPADTERCKQEEGWVLGV
ncbi:MAG: cobalamin biosynthesis protein CbiG [Planctomycetota bacterium]